MRNLRLTSRPAEAGLHNEPPSLYRSEFQRDRDRIIHSTAFRRLEYKTQVFVNHEGDLYRTRLTHSLEVSQIGRTIARALRLNEDLIETICLAHDLGHTPFGHAGQDALNQCMRDFGGFEHNLQSLRVIDLLEKKYPEFDGLNLTFESREGILKHCSRKNAEKLGELGQRFINKTLPSAEAQLADIADSIAYNHHDVDDGLRSGLLTIKQMREVEIFDRHFSNAAKEHPNNSERRHIYETIRRMIGEIVHDLINHSLEILDQANAKNIDDIRNINHAVIQLPKTSADGHLQLKQFLRKNLYRHERVVEMTDQAKKIVEDLFEAFSSDINKMPAEFIAQIEQSPHKDNHKPRIIADYIAGMTDRYAIRRHQQFCSKNGL